MEIFFRIWRFIALLSLGAIFFGEVASLIFHPSVQFWIDLARSAIALVTGDPGKVAALLTTTALSLALVGVVGMIGLDLVRSGVASAWSVVPSSAKGDKSLAWLTYSYPEVAVHYYAKHKSSLLEYLHLTNVGLDKFTHRGAVARFCRDVEIHLEKPDIRDLVSPVNFHYVVTQDQFRAERLRDEISTLEALWIVLPLGLADLAIFQKPLLPTYPIALLFCVLFLLLSLPALAERRRDYAAVLMVGYLANFSLAQAEVADRAM